MSDPLDSKRTPPPARPPAPPPIQPQQPPRPPSLPPMAEQPPQPKTPGQFRNAALGVGIVCAVVLYSLFLFHSRPTESPAIDPRVDEAYDFLMADAYETQKRFVTDYIRSIPCFVTNLSNDAWSSKYLQFSPPADTRIVRNGTHFRVLGTVARDQTLQEGFCYMLEMELDPELGVWTLVGRVNQVRSR